MKKGGPCPKCEARDVVRFAGWTGAYASGNYVIVRRWLIWSEEALVARYVCRNCGYVEEWVDTEIELQRVRESPSLNQAVDESPSEKNVIDQLAHDCGRLVGSVLNAGSRWLYGRPPSVARDRETKYE